MFKPLLYELLTDKAGALDVAPPFKTILAGTSVTFMQVRKRHSDARDLYGGGH